MRKEISGLTVDFVPPIMLRNKEVSKVIVTAVIDETGKKIARAIIHGYKNIILWEGDSYTNAGQWTDTDVINRVKEILTT